MLLIIRSNENETYTHHGSCGGVARWSSKMAPPLIPDGRCRSNKHRGTSPAEPPGTSDVCCISWVIDGSLEKSRTPCVISEYNKMILDQWYDRGHWLRQCNQRCYKLVQYWIVLFGEVLGNFPIWFGSPFWDILSAPVCSQYLNSSTFDIETVLAFQICWHRQHAAWLNRFI